MAGRVLLIRNGETEWNLGGKHASKTETHLTKKGEQDVAFVGHELIGEKKLIDPKTVLRVYCSPSERCLKTVELLRIGVHSHQTFRHREGCTEMTSPEILTSPDHDSKVIDVTPWLREWDYGEYEGLTMAQIHELRKNQGLDKTWNIWDEGCPGGESPQQVSDRLDQLIEEIRGLIRDTFVTWPSGQRGTRMPATPRDIICVGHGHALAAMALRWARQPLKHGMKLLMDTAGVAILSFEYEDFDQPAIVLGRKPATHPEVK